MRAEYFAFVEIREDKGVPVVMAVDGCDESLFAELPRLVSVVEDEPVFEPVIGECHEDFPEVMYAVRARFRHFTDFARPSNGPPRRASFRRDPR